jgi:hypothetical protein
MRSRPLTVTAQARLDLGGLHRCEDVLDSGSDAAVVGVVAFFPAGQLLASAPAVWD